MSRLFCGAIIKNMNIFWYHIKSLYQTNFFLFILFYKELSSYKLLFLVLTYTFTLFLNRWWRQLDLFRHHFTCFIIVGKYSFHLGRKVSVLMGAMMSFRNGRFCQVPLDSLNERHHAGFAMENFHTYLPATYLPPSYLLTYIHSFILLTSCCWLVHRV